MARHASTHVGRREEQVPVAQGQPGLSFSQRDRLADVRTTAQVDVSPPSGLGLISTRERRRTRMFDEYADTHDIHGRQRIVCCGRYVLFYFIF